MDIDEKAAILNVSKCVNVIVSVAIEEAGKYLLVKENKKGVTELWNFPSGKVHFSEDLIDAAKREALEETGYACEITELMNIYYFYWEDMIGVTIRFNFWGKRVSHDKKELAKDVSDSTWFSLEEIDRLAKENKLRAKATYQQLNDIKANLRLPLDTIKKPSVRPE